MLSIALHGALGHMGQVVARLVQETPDLEIACGIDCRPADEMTTFPVFSTLAEANVPYDIVIDFSTASAVDKLLDDCVNAKKPLVLCTTGLSDAQLVHLDAAALEIPVFFSANMSLGINLLTRLAREAARILAPSGFDIEIEERHHHRKLDAPSGTALSIGEALIHELGDDYCLDTGRMERRQARDPKSIGLSSVRGGTIVGEHTVIYAGPDELIEIHHSAQSRDIFARGALSAARFLTDQTPGLYSMDQMLDCYF